MGNTHKFTGKELDSETGLGLYYYGARYYDPGIGRFITPDPGQPDLNDPQTLNPYVYCLNNPLKFVDPDGEEPQEATQRQEPPPPTHVYLPGMMEHWIEKIGRFLGIEPWTSRAISEIWAAAETGQPLEKESIEKIALIEGAKGMLARGMRKDIQKEVKRFSNRSLKQQKREYQNLNKTIEEHYERKGRRTKEIERMEAQLREYKSILEERGQEVD